MTDTPVHAEQSLSAGENPVEKPSQADTNAATASTAENIAQVAANPDIPVDLVLPKRRRGRPSKAEKAAYEATVAAIKAAKETAARQQIQAQGVSQESGQTQEQARGQAYEPVHEQAHEQSQHSGMPSKQVRDIAALNRRTQRHTRATAHMQQMPSQTLLEQPAPSMQPAQSLQSPQQEAHPHRRPGRLGRNMKQERTTPFGRNQNHQSGPNAQNAQSASNAQNGQNNHDGHSAQNNQNNQNNQGVQNYQNNQSNQNNQNVRNNRRNNRRNFAENNSGPSLTREQLSEMKVANLRAHAQELDIDFAGVKKAQLVELVYEASARAEGYRNVTGVLEIQKEGHGFVRAEGYIHGPLDAYVYSQMIRQYGLRPGDFIEGVITPPKAANKSLPPIGRLVSVNGLPPEQMRKRPKFRDLTPIYPDDPLKLENGKDSITGRAIDLVSPIGKGQRGLIVSPPKAGKTTVLKHICQSIAANNPEVHLMCLLVDERPEEVTDMQRSIKGEVIASTFDMPAENHTAVSELVIERAKRIVELGGDVVVVLDSITRLARAYNLAQPASGRILSGGVDSAALYPPKRFLGAARNIENGGSLTIIASALIDTGSKMDEVIFEEFKGTGNMELKLDRDLADKRIFPAIDPVASGTRNEELLIDPALQPFVWGIRRILANMNNVERAESSLVKGLKATNSNEEFLIRSAKKAQNAEHLDAL